MDDWESIQDDYQKALRERAETDPELILMKASIDALVLDAQTAWQSAELAWKWAKWGWVTASLFLVISAVFMVWMSL
jgi:hypothetical protein